MSATQKSTYSAPALEKGLDILEYLAGESEPRSQTEIAGALGRNQSEIYRMLNCLEKRGFLLREESTGNYRLSLHLYHLAHRQSYTILLRRAALLPMDALADRTGQSCHLCVQHGSEVIVLMERMPTQKVCLAVGEGSTLPLSQTASGKVILSRMPAEVVADTLGNDAHYSAMSQSAQKKFLAVVDAIRDTGYFVGNSTQTKSVKDVVAPIGVDNTDTAAVIAMPFVSSSEANDKTEAKYMKAVLACARQINHNMGITS